jgi:hypothetical protein
MLNIDEMDNYEIAIILYALETFGDDIDEGEYSTATELKYKSLRIRFDVEYKKRELDYSMFGT